MNKTYKIMLPRNKEAQNIRTNIKDGGVAVKCGCFYGTLAEFAEKVSEVHGDTLYGREYRAVIEAIKIHFGQE